MPLAPHNAACVGRRAKATMAEKHEAGGTHLHGWRKWLVDNKLRAVGAPPLQPVCSALAGPPKKGATPTRAGPSTPAGYFWATSVAGSFAYQWTKPIPTQMKIIHARVYAQVRARRPGARARLFRRHRSALAAHLRQQDQGCPARALWSTRQALTLAALGVAGLVDVYEHRHNTNQVRPALGAQCAGVPDAERARGACKRRKDAGLRALTRAVRPAGAVQVRAEAAGDGGAACGGRVWQGRRRREVGPRAPRAAAVQGPIAAGSGRLYLSCAAVRQMSACMGGDVDIGREPGMRHTMHGRYCRLWVCLAG